jgi:hypothetical protein
MLIKDINWNRTLILLVHFNNPYAITNLYSKPVSNGLDSK